MSELASKKCVPCTGGVPPLPADRVNELLLQLRGWGIEKGHHLTRTFTLADFRQALALVNRGFEVCLDHNAQALSHVHVSAGQRGANLRIPVADLIRLTHARLVETA